jgi:hypothetical protein
MIKVCLAFPALSMHWLELQGLERVYAVCKVR